MSKEPETGLHNLLPTAKKAAALRTMIMQELHDTTPREYTGTVEEAVKHQLDAFYDACIKFYGDIYKLSYRGLVLSDNSMPIMPLNLTSYILNCGYDLPPTDLPAEGFWQGENHIYRYYPPAHDLAMPQMEVENI